MKVDFLLPRHASWLRELFGLRRPSADASSIQGAAGSSCIGRALGGLVTGVR